jgi:YggT family protein
VLSSLVRLPYSFNPVVRFLYDVCEPYLRLFRRIMPPLGPIDLSPMVGVLVLIGTEQLVVRMLGRLH